MSGERRREAHAIAASAQPSPPPTLTMFEQAVDRLDVIASTPTVVQRLLQVLAEGDSSWREIEELLAVDGTLVTRVLRMAGSPAFAARPMRDLRAALQMLGSEQVRRIAIAAHFSGRGSRFEQLLWAYSLRIAFAADELARACRLVNGPDLFLCGLLHDVGTMALIHFIGTGYAQMGFSPGEDGQCAIESNWLGFDHADLGAMVAARWKLFPELESVAQFHHRPEAGDGLEPTTRSAIDIVALSRVLGRGAGDAAREARVTRDGLCERLGIASEHAEACGRVALERANELGKVAG